MDIDRRWKTRKGFRYHTNWRQCLRDIYGANVADTSGGGAIRTDKERGLQRSAQKLRTPVHVSMNGSFLNEQYE